MGETLNKKWGPEMRKDLRRNPRFDCNGDGAIQKLPVSDEPYPTKILNLSLGGCLMQLQAALVLRMEETVELLFSVHHLPFRVRAKVRAIRPDMLVGFLFFELSERVSMQLEDLIEELTQKQKKPHLKSIAKRPHQPAHPTIRGAGPRLLIKPAKD
jgi:c-di-GMP-binding flagellar brake protein YcgR